MTRHLYDSCRNMYVIGSGFIVSVTLVGLETENSECNGHSFTLLTGTNSWKVVWSLVHFKLLFSARLEWHSWYSDWLQAGLFID